MGRLLFIQNLTNLLSLSLLCCMWYRHMFDSIRMTLLLKMALLFIRSYYNDIFIWVKSRRCGCLVTWFCYQMIAKPDNKIATPSWPDPYAKQHYNDIVFKDGMITRLNQQWFITEPLGTIFSENQYRQTFSQENQFENVVCHLFLASVF